MTPMLSLAEASSGARVPETVAFAFGIITLVTGGFIMFTDSAHQAEFHLTHAYSRREREPSIRQLSAMPCIRMGLERAPHFGSPDHYRSTAPLLSCQQVVKGVREGPITDPLRAPTGVSEPGAEPSARVRLVERPGVDVGGAITVDLAPSRADLDLLYSRSDGAI